MNDEDKDKLKQIKAKILDELVELSDSDDIPAEQRFTLMMSSAAGTNNAELFGRAHEAAKQIDDGGNKVRSLMDLLEEIDISLGNITAGPMPESKDQPSDKVPSEGKPAEENSPENQN